MCDPSDVIVRPLEDEAADAPAVTWWAGWWMRRAPSEQVWAIEQGGERLATVELVRDRPQTLRLRGLHFVRRTPLPAIVPALLKHLVRYCHQRGYLKVVIESPCDLDHAGPLMHEHGLEFTGRRDHADGATVEYYVDLYRPDDHADTN